MAGPGRRPHSKSREGCVQCKQRRIKKTTPTLCKLNLLRHQRQCNEARPSCDACVRKACECIYLPLPPKPPESQDQRATKQRKTVHTPASTDFHSPSPSLINPSRHEWNPEDLELLHFYTTSTCFTLSNLEEKCQLWQIVVPQIAFSHDFLLHGLLTLAALHMIHEQPHRKQVLESTASRHYDKALSSYRTAVCSITPKNCDACYAFSTIIVVNGWVSLDQSGDLFWKRPPGSSDDGGTAEWLQLLRGARSLVKHHYDWLSHGPLHAFLDLGAEEREPSNAISDDIAKFAALENSWSSSVPTLNADELQTLKTSLDWMTHIYVSLCLPTARFDTVGAVVAWPVLVPEEYFQMVNRRQPEALALLAHYSLLLNKVNDFWWIRRGMSRRLLQNVHDILGPEMESSIAWPLQDLVLSEFRTSNMKNDDGPA